MFLFTLRIETYLTKTFLLKGKEPTMRGLCVSEEGKEILEDI